MGKRIEGQLNLTDIFNIQYPGPVDDRLCWDNFSDLTNPNEMMHTVLYKGLTVTVNDDNGVPGIYIWNGDDLYVDSITTSDELDHWINSTNVAKLKEQLHIIDASNNEYALISDSSKGQIYIGNNYISVGTDSTRYIEFPFTGTGIHTTPDNDGAYQWNQRSGILVPLTANSSTYITNNEGDIVITSNNAAVNINHDVSVNIEKLDTSLNTNILKACNSSIYADKLDIHANEEFILSVGDTNINIFEFFDGNSSLYPYSKLVCDPSLYKTGVQWIPEKTLHYSHILKNNKWLSLFDITPANYSGYKSVYSINNGQTSSSNNAGVKLLVNLSFAEGTHSFNCTYIIGINANKTEINRISCGGDDTVAVRIKNTGAVFTFEICDYYQSITFPDALQLHSTIQILDHNDARIISTIHNNVIGGPLKESVLHVFGLHDASLDTTVNNGKYGISVQSEEIIDASITNAHIMNASINLLDVSTISLDNAYISNLNGIDFNSSTNLPGSLYYDGSTMQFGGNIGYFVRDIAFDYEYVKIATCTVKSPVSTKETHYGMTVVVSGDGGNTVYNIAAITPALGKTPLLKIYQLGEIYPESNSMNQITGTATTSGNNIIFTIYLYIKRCANIGDHIQWEFINIPFNDIDKWKLLTGKADIKTTSNFTNFSGKRDNLRNTEFYIPALMRYTYLDNWTGAQVPTYINMPPSADSAQKMLVYTPNAKNSADVSTVLEWSGIDDIYLLAKKADKYDAVEELQSIGDPSTNYFMFARQGSINSGRITSAFMQSGIYDSKNCVGIDKPLHVRSYVRATGYHCSSDERLKSDIRSIASETICPTIHQFIWNDTSAVSYGFIAQELENDGLSHLVYNDNNGYKTVDYNAALSLTVGKLQEEIIRLNNRINELEQRLLK